MIYLTAMATPLSIDAVADDTLPLLIGAALLISATRGPASRSTGRDSPRPSAQRNPASTCTPT